MTVHKFEKLRAGDFVRCGYYCIYAVSKIDRASGTISVGRGWLGLMAFKYFKIPIKCPEYMKISQ